jgi:hypothetical protein
MDNIENYDSYKQASVLQFSPDVTIVVQYFLVMLYT